jgi:hypothetical protein
MGKKIIIGILIVVLLIVASLFWMLTLVRTEFNEVENVETMNRKIDDKINKLFVEDQRFVFYLPNRQVEVRLGEHFGMAFGIKNLLETQRFTWEVYVNDSEVYEKCDLEREDAENWITTGRKGFAYIEIGYVYTDIVRFKPRGPVSDNCKIRFGFLVLDEEGEQYYSGPFDVHIKE